MNTLNQNELMEIEGGNIAVFALGASAYMSLLTKIEQNPGSYTWTMDWYYEN